MFCSGVVIPWCNSLGPCRCFDPLGAIRPAPVDVVAPPWCNPLDHCRCFGPLGAIHSTTVDVLPALGAIHSTTVDVLHPLVQSARPLSMFWLPRCNSLDHCRCFGPAWSNPLDHCRCFATLGAIHSTTVDVLPPLVQSTRPLSMFSILWCNPPGPCRCFGSLDAIRPGPCRCFDPLMQFAQPLSMFWPLDAIRSAPVGVCPPLLVQSASRIKLFKLIKLLGPKIV